MKIPLDQLLSFETIPPSKGLIKSIERFGQRVPILVVSIAGKFRVEDGKRRVEALWQLGGTEVEAIVSDDLDESVLTLLGNLQRSENPIAEGEAIQALIENGWTKHTIAKDLGIPQLKIYSRLRLIHNLIPELKKKIANGKMSCEAGRIASSLSRSEQVNLAINDKVTIGQARSARRMEQLSLLDLESITIPKVSELDSLLNDISRLCPKLKGGWEKDALVNAIRALESLRGE